VRSWNFIRFTSFPHKVVSMSVWMLLTSEARAAAASCLLDVDVLCNYRSSALVQVVSRRPLTAEARVRPRLNPCGICDGQSGNGTFLSEFFGFPLSIYNSTVALQTHFIWGMRNMLT
jgi:hypothetical protein